MPERTLEWRVKGGQDMIVIVETEDEYHQQNESGQVVDVLYEAPPETTPVADMLTEPGDLDHWSGLVTPASEDPDAYGTLIMWRNGHGTGIEDRMHLAERLNALYPVGGDY